MSQLQVTGEAKIRDIQGPVVANSGVITALDGDASQYVRGDGTLADFPTSTGGGSSVSYYLNSSVSQGTIGGVAYRQLGKTPIGGAGTDIAISTTGYVASYITDANDPALLEVPAGNFNCEFYFSVNNNTGNPFVYAEVYKYDGTTFTIIGTSVGVPEYINQGTVINPYYFAVPVAQSILTVTDRIAIRIYVNVDGRTVTLHTENNHLCQVVTTFSKGLISLNNLTRQNQFFATGTSGTDFGISSSVATHTFNLPIASASNTGKLSSTDWSTFNNKQNTITDPITGTGNSTQIAYFNSPTSITSEAAFNYDASTNRLGVNTSVPNATIGANAGTDSGYSLLLKNDNANYNGIGFGTDSTYGNLLATEKLGTAPARNLTLLNQSGYISITEVGNLGVNILNPNTGLDIYNGTSAFLWLHTANSGITGTDGVRLALFSTNAANLRNFEGAFSITAEGDFSIITLGAENLRVNSSDGSIYQSKVANAMLKSVSGVITAAVANTDYQSPISLTTSGSSGAATFSSNTLNVPNYTLSGLGGVPTSRTLSINGVSYDLSADRSWTITSDITGSGADGRVAYWNGTNSITSEAGFIYDASTNRLGVNTSVPNATIGADAALNSGYGLLIKTGASNYNGIGIAIDSTYGNTIETAKLGTASARNLTLLNQSGFVSLTESGAFGVGILTPNNGIDIYNSTQSQLWLHNNASGLTATDGVRLALFNNLSANLRNFDGGLSLTAEGDFQIITIGAENLRVNSANGFIGIGNPATLTSLLTVNGSITQSVTSALLKTNASGTIIAAVAGTDYVIPSALSGYLPLSGGTLTGALNGTSATFGFLLTANSGTSNNTNAITIAASTLPKPHFGSAFGATFIQNNNYYNGSSYVYDDNTIGSSFITLNDTISFGTGAANTIPSTKLTIANNGTATFSGEIKSGDTITLGASAIGGFWSWGASVTYLVAGSGKTLNLNPNGIAGTTGLSIATNGDTTLTGLAPILAIQSSTTGNLFLRFRHTVDTVATLFYQNSSSSFNIANNIGELRFSTGSVSSAMVIANNGNVGISQNTPSALLHLGVANAAVDGTKGVKITNPAGTTVMLECGVSSDSFVGTTSASDFSIRTGNSERMRITNDGNVGIGTNSPIAKLDVRGTIYAGQAGGNIQFKGSIDGGIFTSGNLIYFSDWVNATKGLYINLSTGVTTIQTLGSGTVTATSGTLSAVSDMNLKIEDGFIDNALEKVLKLKPRYFHWKEETGLPTDLRQLGFYAQEVNIALGEEAANTPKTENDKWGIYDRAMIAFLTRAIQEQQEQIQELKVLINK